MTTTTHIAPAHLARMLSHAGLHRLSGNALHAICAIQAAGGSMSMTHLARALGISSAAITGLVDRLEEKALVQRTTGLDRRVHHITTTPAATLLLTDILNA
jgi:DNA-binding MarR family transcriptional regulator